MPLVWACTGKEIMTQELSTLRRDLTLARQGADLAVQLQQELNALKAKIAAAQSGKLTLSEIFICDAYERSEDNLRAELNTVKSAGRSMRAAQKDYFRTRQAEALTLSKKLEREFDEMLKEETALGKQGSLI